MNVVGRVGSLISQGVYSVATPFHPFGGAVDIIIVEQEDGTYRSTPWYVRFGKFQGVLKGAEKIVGISVNGMEAEFHMFLDNSGEAYFVKEVECGSNTDAELNDTLADSVLPGSSPGGSVNESNDGFIDNNGECNGKVENGEEPNGFDDGDSPLEGSVGSSGFVPYHYGSLDEVEDMVESSHNSNSEMVLVSVDGHVLTAPVSSNEESSENLQLSTPQFHLGPGDSSGDNFPNGDTWDAGMFDILDASLRSSKDTSDCLSGDLDASSPISRKSHESPSAACEEANLHSDNNTEDESLGSMAEMIASSEEVIPGLSRNETFMSCLEFSDLTTEMDDLGSPIMASSAITNARDDSECTPENSPCSISLSDKIGHTNVRVLNGACDGQSHPVLSSLDEHEGSSVENGTAECENHYNVSVSLTTDGRGPDVCSASNSSVSLLSDGFPSTEINPSCVQQENIIAESVDIIVPPVSMSTSTYLRSSSTEHEGEPTESNSSKHIAEDEHGGSEFFVSGSERKMSNLGFELSLCGNLLHAGMGSNSANDFFETHIVSKETFEASWESIIKNESLILRFKGKYFRWDKAAAIVLGMAVFGAELSIELKDHLPVEEVAKKVTPCLSPSPSGRGWKLWPIPFRRVKSFKHTDSDASNAETLVDSQSFSNDHEAEQLPPNSGPDNQSPRKHFVRTNIPTTEQIASLKLKDGQNTVAFSFCTRVLGKQHVDAHIYLWKWNARIVISDVDGTITKSDVLGQFMPLVGKDWSQSGVAWLFSAIKENGYQLLFLSARAIVQAYLTRSFLRNLKQDGKTLPNGPIVISPDGLFPSLYREVIRRAPHEFKIACLEDIKALFPADYNPFYAGFGNRDTDELSYRKIGIPKGKIFIINPKGEVAINHCIDVKSYTSLHTLVNDMFPPTSLVEQEDFNSWNYWKMPLPSIDC